MNGRALLRWSSLLSVVALSASALGACAAPDEAEDAEIGETEDELKACANSDLDWQKDMFEEFDTWDETRWTKFNDHVPPRTTTCYTADNVQVKGGKLHIATKKGVVCKEQPHTGGAIESYGKIATGKYFKAEIRVKVSQQQGIFGAPLWFRPGNAAGPTGPGGEIDVVEVLGAGKDGKPKFHTTLHPDYGDTTSERVHDATPFEKVADESGEKFHVYTVEKVPNGITFYTDGKRTAGWGCGHKDNAKRPAYYKKWFEAPEGWSFRIDNKVGGPWAGEPNKFTVWGNETAMVIDYIKLWKPKN
jgi:beta-glucanase (GH16 family)